jgi:dephospho-CoA kinase
MFRELGCVVIDADALAREVVEPGQPAYQEIVAAFGHQVLGLDGRLDRQALGAIVFADPEQRKRLESITHPRIRERFQAQLAELTERGFDGVVLFDAPVIIESGGAAGLDRLVVVVADETAQVARQQARDHAGVEDAIRRIRSQMPLAEKMKLADYVIDNRGVLAATKAQVADVHRALLAALHARHR